MPATSSIPQKQVDPSLIPQISRHANNNNPSASSSASPNKNNNLNNPYSKQKPVFAPPARKNATVKSTNKPTNYISTSNTEKPAPPPYEITVDSVELPLHLDRVTQAFEQTIRQLNSIQGFTSNKRTGSGVNPFAKMGVKFAKMQFKLENAILDSGAKISRILERVAKDEELELSDFLGGSDMIRLKRVIRCMEEARLSDTALKDEKWHTLWHDLDVVKHLHKKMYPENENLAKEEKVHEESHVKSLKANFIKTMGENNVSKKIINNTANYLGLDEKDPRKVSKQKAAAVGASLVRAAFQGIGCLGHHTDGAVEDFSGLYDERWECANGTYLNPVAKRMWEFHPIEVDQKGKELCNDFV